MLTEGAVQQQLFKLDLAAAGRQSLLAGGSASSTDAQPETESTSRHAAAQAFCCVGKAASFTLVVVPLSRVASEGSRKLLPG